MYSRLAGAAARADYDCRPPSERRKEIVRGESGTKPLGITPTTQFQVESIQSLEMPDSNADTVETIYTTKPSFARAAPT
jgi:hypothetical protein